MSENKLFRIKEDGMLLVKAVGFLVKLGKLKLEMRGLEKQKQQVLRAIGMTTLNIYREQRSLDGETVLSAVQHDLADLDAIDQELQVFEENIAQVRSEFRARAGMAAPGSPANPPKQS